MSACPICLDKILESSTRTIFEITKQAIALAESSDDVLRIKRLTLGKKGLFKYINKHLPWVNAAKSTLLLCRKHSFTMFETKGFL